MAIENKPVLVKKALLIEWILIAYNILEAVASIGFGIRAGSITLAREG